MTATTTDGTSTVSIRVVDNTGSTVAVTTSVYLIVDDSLLYRQNATSGEGIVNIVGGTGTATVHSNISGVVTLRTSDFLSTNILTSLSVNVTFYVPVPATPPLGHGYLYANFSTTGVPCSSFNSQFLASMVHAFATAMGVSDDMVTPAAVTCGDGTVLNRRTIVSSMLFSFLIIAPESQIGPLQTLVTQVTTTPTSGNSPLVAALLQDAVISAIMASVGGTLSTSAAVTAVEIAGVNCTGSSWSSWSSCAYQTCGSGYGIQVRTLRCPMRAEAQLCNAPACANCSINNGGCDANATCGAKFDGSVSCTCPSTFVGDGFTCVLRDEASSLSLIAQVVYPIALSAVAPTVIDQFTLESRLLALAATALSIPATRFAFAQLSADTASTFSFIFSVAPPMSTSDATASQLQTVLIAAIAAGQLNLNSTQATLSSAATSTNINPGFAASSGASTSTVSSSSLIAVIVIACALGVIVIVLAFMLLRRKRSISVSKGPVWLPQQPQRSRVLILQQPEVTASAMSRNMSADPLFSEQTEDNVLMSKSTRPKSASPVHTVEVLSPVRSVDTGATRTQDWEMDVIENDMPSVGGMRHYYPAWEAPKSSSVTSPWI